MSASTSQHITLSHRLLMALGVVSFLFWAVMATLSTRNNIADANALYDVHLAYTAQAFLHMMDPDHGEKQTMPKTLPSETIAQLLSAWPRLAQRPGSAQPATAKPDEQHSAPDFGAVPSPVAKTTPYSHLLRFQLWRDGGELLFRSDNAPPIVMTEVLGLSDSVDAQGIGWRNYKVYDINHGVHMIVSEPHAFRAQLARNMIFSAATPLLLGLPVLLLLLWFSVRKGLHPLATLSHEISQRQPGNLTPIDATSVPGEVQPIVSALNALLARMEQTLESERRFTDDAAHQLRTPLAALQTQLYTACHTQAQEPHQQALAQMQHSVERGIRLVNQLLTLARLDPKQTPPEFASLHLERIVETISAELAPLALQREQNLELTVAPGLPAVTGNADLLTMLIANLLDNAIHYTPRGGHIAIGLETDGNVVQLTVSDDGPGIAPEQRQRVFERFYRIAGQNQPGTGLGLAICKRIAELHHATLTLSDGLQGRGLTVRVHFAK